MTNAEQAQGQLPELAALRQCLTELALLPAVRQTLDSVFTESEKRLQQRLEQMTWQVQRSALLGDIAGKIVHELRHLLNAIFLHADVVQGALRCPTLDSRAQIGDDSKEPRGVRPTFPVIAAPSRLASHQGWYQPCFVVAEGARSPPHLPGQGRGTEPHKPGAGLAHALHSLQKVCSVRRINHAL